MLWKRTTVVCFIAFISMAKNSPQLTSRAETTPCSLEACRQVSENIYGGVYEFPTQNFMLTQRIDKAAKRVSQRADNLQQVCNFSLDELRRIFDNLHIEKYRKSNETNSTNSFAYSTSFFLSLKLLVNKVTKQKIDKETEEKTIFHPAEFDLFRFLANTCSIMCLLLLLKTFHLFKELRTVPGKYLIYLSIFLTAGHSLMLLSSHAKNERKFCCIVGILTHWVYLTVFSLMTVIAFDILRTFGFSVQLRRSDKFRRYQASLGAAMCSPVVITIPCIAIHFIGKAEVYSGSGGTCFVMNVWANLIAFVIPVGVVLIFNTICIAVTILNIHKTQKRTSNVLKKKARKSRLRVFVLTLKLATVTGFGWIFGFVGALTDIRAFQMAFTILCSLQGLNIFAGFMCRKRIFALYKRKWNSRNYEFKYFPTKNTKMIDTVKSK